MQRLILAGGERGNGERTFSRYRLTMGIFTWNVICDADELASW